MSFPIEAEAEAVALLAELVKADTTNPPGNERACAEILAESLRADGYEPLLLEKQPGRTNLVVRRKGDGSGGGPLLLTGHLDVVPADPAGWKHPPFSAEIDGGWLYGRGAVDMKSHLAACTTILKVLARQGTRLKRDLIFAAVADEEAGCELGARFLVDEHPERVRADWAIGEAGGFTVKVGEKRIYPIQIAHKGAVWISMKASGPTGHSSMPRPDSAVLRLARAMARIGNKALPVHATGSVQRMLGALGRAHGFPASLGLAMLARPSLADFALENLISDPVIRRSLDAVLRNTATPTVLRAGEATNVLPAEAEAHLDGRVLPGQSTAGLLAELRAVVDDPEVTFTVMKELSAVESPADSPLYGRLAAAVRELDPEGIPVPYVMPGFTDASAFCRLGMRFYGFTPLRLPDDAGVAFSELPHAVDERIPVEGFGRGLGVLHGVVVDFCSS